MDLHMIELEMRCSANGMQMQGNNGHIIDLGQNT